MKDLTLTQINEILLQLNSLGSRYKKLSSNTSANYHEEKNMGEYGTKVDIYDIGHPAIFLKAVSQSDSYGGNESVSSIQFVSAVEKTVIGYEPLK